MNNLLKAALMGDLQSVKTALAEGNNIDSVESEHGNTALILASYQNHAEVVRFLIHSGANIETRCKAKNTALIKAAWNGSVESLNLLIQAGAQINVVDDSGIDSLMVAAHHGHFSVVKILVENGIDLRRTDPDGFTALRYAKLQGHPQIVDYLRKVTGLDRKVTIVDKLGKVNKVAWFLNGKEMTSFDFYLKGDTRKDRTRIGMLAMEDVHVYDDIKFKCRMACGRTKTTKLTIAVRGNSDVFLVIQEDGRVVQKTMET